LRGGCSTPPNHSLKPDRSSLSLQQQTSNALTLATPAMVLKKTSAKAITNKNTNATEDDCDSNDDDNDERTMLLPVIPSTAAPPTNSSDNRIIVEPPPTTPPASCYHAQSLYHHPRFDSIVGTRKGKFGGITPAPSSSSLSSAIKTMDEQHRETDIKVIKIFLKLIIYKFLKQKDREGSSRDRRTSIPIIITGGHLSTSNGYQQDNDWQDIVITPRQKTMQQTAGGQGVMSLKHKGSTVSTLTTRRPGLRGEPRYSTF
jgi:hypothetical protein